MPRKSTTLILDGAWQTLLIGAFLLMSGMAAQAGAGNADSAGETATETAATPPRNEDTNPYTGDPAAIAEGQDLWRDTGCYSCHGGAAEGGVGPNLTDDVWVYKPTDKTLFKAIAEGRSGTNMVGWSEDLSEDQIWKVIAYIRSLYKGDPGKIIW